MCSDWDGRHEHRAHPCIDVATPHTSKRPRFCSLQVFQPEPQPVSYMACLCHNNLDSRGVHAIRTSCSCASHTAAGVLVQRGRRELVVQLHEQGTRAAAVSIAGKPARKVVLEEQCRTLTKRSLALSASMPLMAAQASQRALPSKSRPPRSAHMGRSVWLSPWVACEHNSVGRPKLGAAQRLAPWCLGPADGFLAAGSPACAGRTGGRSHPA